ncbi:MAG: hypothetical protein Q4A16_02860 [Lautropia sp.]|nr:hypothetical protein [Lautropia sp.]
MKSSTSPVSPAPLVLVGHSLAVLVAATERAHRGLPTTIVNPGAQPLGGWFAGVQALGRRHDAGMMFFEFSSREEPIAPPRLDSYDPMKRNDVGRFCAVVRRYVQSYQSTRPIGMPRMWVDGQLLPDMMTGQGLSALPHLRASAAIHRELSSISQQIRHDTVLWHPSNHKTWPVDASAPADWSLAPAQHDALRFDCDTLSRRLHGQSLHEALFLPFARQMLNRDASHLAAAYHQVPRLAMYAPDALLAAMDGKATAPTAIFNHPQQHTVADLCQQLAQMVRNDPLITLIEDRILHLGGKPQDFLLMLQAHGELRARRLGWALTPSDAISAAGMMAAPDVNSHLPLLLGFFRLPTDALRHGFSVVHAVSNDTGIYRVTHSTQCGTPTEAGFTELVIEANRERFTAFHGQLADDGAIEQAMLHDLTTMTLLKPGSKPAAFELHRIDEGPALPTLDAVATSMDERQRMQHHFPGIELLGDSAAPFATSLSDQIIQGLQQAHRNELDSDGIPMMPAQTMAAVTQTENVAISH